MLKDDGTPIFQQIAAQIERDILADVYPAETPVPSTNELAAFLRVNPATAGKGLNLLVERGLLYKRRGIGMYVTGTAKESLRRRRIEEFAQSYIHPLLREAADLGLTRDQVTEMIREEDRS